MHHYKRINKLIYLVFSVCCFITFYNLHPAKAEIQNNQLDSVYNAYSKLRGIHTENSMTSQSNVTNSKGHKCSFNLVSTLLSNKNKLSLSRQKILSQLYERPVLDQSITSPANRFRIHYSSTGNNVPTFDTNLTIADNVKQVAIAFDSAYNYEINNLGYLAPPNDNGIGGDNLYDIYIINYAGEVYGETMPEENITDKNASFIQIDNNYSAAERYGARGLDGMRATAAHEFHHAIQVGNYGGWPSGDDGFFYEITSTSMEEFVFDSVNDYYFYLDDYFRFPDQSFPQYAGYELAIWNIYLVEKYGIGGHELIKRQWELKATIPSLTAINTSFVEKGHSFKDELNEFAVWVYFTGYRKKYDIKNEYFEEGVFYPEIRFFPFDFTPPAKSTDFLIKPLSTNFFKFINTASSGILKDSIVFIITNSDYNKAIQNPSQDLSAQLVISSQNISGGSRLSDNYFWKVNSSEINFINESAILNNVSPTGRIIEVISNDEAYPVPFSYNTNSFLLIPAENNDTKFAEVKIFTVSMDLVYSGKKEIISDVSNKYVVNWNGLDSKNNKLPTGIYIYVTSSEEKIKMGKLVIKNE